MLFLSLKKGFENELQESVIFRKKNFKTNPTSYWFDQAIILS